MNGGADEILGLHAGKLLLDSWVELCGPHTDPCMISPPGRTKSSGNGSAAPTCDGLPRHPCGGTLGSLGVLESAYDDCCTVNRRVTFILENRAGRRMR